MSSGRLVKGAKESAGKRYGTPARRSGRRTQKGPAPKRRSCSSATIPGPKVSGSLREKHGQGQALTVLAPQLARAVYDLLKRGVVCDRDTVLQSSEEPASLQPNARGEPRAMAAVTQERRLLRVGSTVKLGLAGALAVRCTAQSFASLCKNAPIFGRTPPPSVPRRDAHSRTIL